MNTLGKRHREGEGDGGERKLRLVALFGPRAGALIGGPSIHPRCHSAGKVGE